MFKNSGVTHYHLLVVSSFFRGGAHKTSLSQQNGCQKAALLRDSVLFVAVLIEEHAK